MRPVGQETWDEAIRRVLADNKRRGRGPTTLGELQRELSSNGETARKTLKRVRARNRATPAMVTRFAAALQVDASQLPPPAHRLTVEQLEDRLEALEDAAVQAPDLYRAQLPLRAAI